MRQLLVLPARGRNMRRTRYLRVRFVQLYFALDRTGLRLLQCDRNMLRALRAKWRDVFGARRMRMRRLPVSQHGWGTVFWAVLRQMPGEYLLWQVSTTFKTICKIVLMTLVFFLVCVSGLGLFGSLWRVQGVCPMPDVRNRPDRVQRGMPQSLHQVHTRVCQGRSR